MNLSSFNFSKSIGLVVALGVLILLFVGYMMLRGKAPEAGVTVADGQVGESEATFVILASQLDTIVFDTSLFDDPRFKALQDIHTAILVEDLKRPDPFAPIGR